MPVDTKKCTKASIGAAVAEFVGMYLFVLTGAGSAMTGSGVLQVALTFGLAITALAYAFGHHSGGQFNCAVTWGLVVAGKLGAVQGALNFIAQLLGAVLAGFTARVIIPSANDATYGGAAKAPGVASNVLATKYASSAFVGEALFTFLLVIVVLETACSKRTSHLRGHAALAIGVAVFLGHSVLIPIDGCSINPTRTIGTGVAAWATNDDTTVSPWANFWIFFFGPLLGATLAAPVFHLLRMFAPVDSAWLVDPPKKKAPAPVPKPEPLPVVEPLLPPLMPQQFIPSYSMQMAAPTTAYAAMPQTTAYAAVPQTTSYAVPATTGYASPYGSPYGSPAYGGIV